MLFSFRDFFNGSGDQVFVRVNALPFFPSPRLYTHIHTLYESIHTYTCINIQNVYKC